jgi:hypothetical protein
MLTTGWNNLRNVYNFNGNKKVFFNYLGRSRFSFTIGNNIENDNQIPSFHSRSTKPGRTVYFDITLNNLQMAIPSILVFSCYIYSYNFLRCILLKQNCLTFFFHIYIQILPPRFHDFLWEYDFSDLTLWGERGTQAICKIEYKNPQSAYSKLGKNWEEFSLANGFNMGDQLRFKFIDRCFSEHVCVYKINP